MHHSEGFVDLGPATCNQSVLNVLSRKIGVWVILLCGLSCLQCPHVGQIDQIDHDLDHPDPNLPLWDVVPDLWSTHLTQETCVESCRVYGSHPATRDNILLISICLQISRSWTRNRWSVRRAQVFIDVSIVLTCITYSSITRASSMCRSYICVWRTPSRSQHLRRDQQGGSEANPPAPDAREHAQLPHIRKSVFRLLRWFVCQTLYFLIILGFKTHAGI